LVGFETNSNLEARPCRKIGRKPRWGFRQVRGESHPLRHEKRQVSTETCRFSMISVPAGTGDISSIWYPPAVGDICLRHMKERILYHACEASISYGGSRISYCVAIYHLCKSSNSYAKTAKISFL